MKLGFIRKIILVGGVVVMAGGARADYKTYDEAKAAARSQYNQGHYVEAQKSVEEAVALAKTTEEKRWAFSRLARVDSDLKLYPQSREQWEKYLLLPGLAGDDRALAYVGIAGTYNEEKNYEQGRTELQKIVDDPEIRPESKAAARLGIAGFSQSLKEPVKAHAAFLAIAEDKAMEVHLRSQSYFMDGQLSIDEKHYAQARDSLTKALALSDIDLISAGIHAKIADTFQAEGNQTQAQVEYVRAQNAEIVAAKVLVAKNQFAAARVLFQKALEFAPMTPPRDAHTRILIGQYYTSEGNLKAAGEQFETVQNKQYDLTNLTPKDKDEVTALQQRAMLLVGENSAEQQNKAQARQIIRDLLAKPNLDPGVKTEAQKYLDSLN